MCLLGQSAVIRTVDLDHWKAFGDVAVGLWMQVLREALINEQREHDVD
jgi:hypothetical protein